MLKRYLLLSAFALAAVLKVNAQTDTSNYDLGRISVKKDFTQTITIKGSDLERYQFSDLADAINVWLYGTYSNSSNLLYVIDGNIINDVNAYSIYDIDEITLVQNAAAYVSGASLGAQVVLIKLKTNRQGKQGIEAAGQTSLVNLRNDTHMPGTKSTNNVYNQYYLSGYKNFDHLQVGVSADYQRDVLPVLTNGTLTSLNPYNFNRFKFNGYAAGQLWRGTTLNFNINYVPQTDAFEYAFTNQSEVGAQSQAENAGVVQHMASSNIALNTKLTSALSNTLSGAYNHYNFFGEEAAHFESEPQGPTADYSNSLTHDYIKATNFLLRDNLAYHGKIGVFDVEPAINFSYRNFKEILTSTSFYLSEVGNGIPAVSESESANGAASKVYFLTPSVDIHYKDMADLQGGFSDVLNGAKDFDAAYSYSRMAPFLTASADVLKLAAVSNMSLRIFASFSRQSQLFNDNSASLSGINPFIYLITNTTIGFTETGNSTATGVYTVAARNPYRQYNNFQAGFEFAIIKNLTLSYNYLNYQSEDVLQVAVPVGANGSATELAYYYDKVSTNRIALNYTYNISQFNWRTGLNASESLVKPEDPTFANDTYRSYLSNGHRYSGGFTNRFAYRSFFAGLDLLYQSGDRLITLASIDPYKPGAPAHINSVSLQSLYFGTRIRINGSRYAEVFANTRNMLQNNTSDITDNRRFYGLGFKLDL